MTYIKHLDSIRAIAVLLVIFWHWIPKDNIINTLPNGQIGVDTFFVLSGFLITGILLKNKNEAEELSIKRGRLLKNFYARRAIRIFPIYYLCIIAVVLLAFHYDVPMDNNEVINSITYTTNFYFFNIKEWGSLTAHFWSLAVEEQFYLLWPFLILFCHKKYLLPLILLFIAIGIGSRFFYADVNFSHILTYSCFDAFGLGALLAWIKTYKHNSFKTFYNYSIMAALISCCLTIFNYYNRLWLYHHNRLFYALMALCLITYIIDRESEGKNPFFIFKNPVSHFLGKISYGIYLYHLPIGWLSFIFTPVLQKVLPKSIIHNFNLPIYFSLCFVILIILSWLSWKYIEKPILYYKKFF